MSPSSRRFVAALLAIAAPGVAQKAVPSASATPRELGRVAFARDLDAVLRSAPPKPLFLLFQEIPG